MSDKFDKSRGFKRYDNGQRNARGGNTFRLPRSDQSRRGYGRGENPSQSDARGASRLSMLNTSKSHQKQHRGEHRHEPQQMTNSRLKTWAEAENSSDLALFMSNEIEQIRGFLMADSIKDYQFNLFVSALCNATNTQLQKTAVKKILVNVCETPFLVQHLTAFVMCKIESQKSQENKSFLQSMICIIENVLKYCPLNAIKCLAAIPQLRNVNGFYDWTDITEKMNQIEEKAKQVYRSAVDNPHDGPPPDDFLESSVLPTIEDLREDKKVYLRPAKVQGGYDDTRHYLDVQFRLLRQDFIIPLQQGISEFKKSGFKRNFKTQDIRLYHDVHILGIVTRDFIDHVVQFDVSQLRFVKWEHSRRFMNGSLLCFSKDGFETFAIATVANRDPNDLKKGYVNVNFKTGLEIVFNSTSNDEFVMAETVAYYESYCHVLEGLQELADNLPLEEHIVRCVKEVQPPQYLLQGSGSYDLSPLMRVTKCSKIVPVLSTTQWPQVDSMSLNESQRQAAQLALTKQLAVIQGPPGTGKTYVGLKVVQTLLLQLDKGIISTQLNGSPILIVCYTNHALDQFLEGIMDFCPKGIVRVGGRSDSEKLKACNLREIQRNRSKGLDMSVFRARKDCQRDLKRIAEVIERATKKLESTSCRIFSLSALEEFIKESHNTSLRFGRHSTDFVREGNIISQWLNAREEDPEIAVDRIIDNALTGLILNSKMNDVPHDSICKEMPIQNRASLYMFYVFRLRALLRKEREELQPFKDHPHAHEAIQSINHMIEQSDTQILSDDTMKKVIPEKHFKRIQAIHGKEIKVSLIKKWLGIFAEQHLKLDYIEQLQKTASGSQHELERIVELEDDKPDIFVEMEEDVTENYRSQTKSLENSLSSKVQRIFALGLDAREEENNTINEGWQIVGKSLGFSQITKKLRKIKPMTETNEEKVDNVWNLSSNDRFALYKRWVEQFKEKIIEEIQESVREYKSLRESYREIKGEETASILREAKVIGMTTTGAAKHRSVLQEVGCRIIVVEEAAEVLEAHIVTALNKQLQHLILIGDHQQLRPNPCVYDLAKKFGMEISLFERLIKNELPHKVLLEQHRMRPEISKIMCHIYPDLQDHPVVSSYEHIKGVAKDIYLIQHEERESKIVDSHSKANDFEAIYAIKLCKYLLLQGYDPKQITILATYAGQVTNIRTKMRQGSQDSGIRITAVDNFQGEENDIIILSLVRSNDEDNVGFLKVDNRVCVALSRAKMGLYIIGNFNQLEPKSTLWRNIIQTAKTDEIIGEGLPVICQNHPEKDPVLMFRGTDFDQRPEGGCGADCGSKLMCGHICERKCHGYDPNHDKYKCSKSCTKTCALGHPCMQKCYQVCGDCKFKIKKIIPQCGHEDLVPCHMPPDEAVCCQPCEKMLDCGHQCVSQCGHCKLNGKHNICKAIVEHTWPCGHKVTVKCCKVDLPCPQPCNAVLDCGHKCKGSCNECLQGKIHLACKERCREKLLCGHMCAGFCGEPCPPCKELCPFSCRHGSCERSNKKQSPNCGHICPPCQEKCLRKCACKTCDKICSQVCDISPCQKPCKRELKCGHKCQGICGELCVCIKCKEVESLSKTLEAMGITFKHDSNETGETVQPGDDENSKNVNFDQTDSKSSKVEQKSIKAQDQDQKKPLVICIPKCTHVFYIDELDKYVENFDPGGSSYIPCPRCGKPIQQCTRYETVNMERAEKRSRLKELQKRDIYISSELAKVMLAKSKEVIEKSELTKEFIQLKTDQITKKCEMEAVSFQLKLAFVLSQISSFESDTSLAFSDVLSLRKSALLRISKYVSLQQKREFIIEFANCLSQGAVNKIKDIRGGASNMLSIDLSMVTSIRRRSPDTFLDMISREIDAVLIDIRKDQGQTLQLATQYKLIEKTIDRAMKVLRSKDSEQLQDIVGDPMIPSIKGPLKSSKEKTANKKDACHSKSLKSIAGKDVRRKTPTSANVKQLDALRLKQCSVQPTDPPKPLDPSKHRWNMQSLTSTLSQNQEETDISVGDSKHLRSLFGLPTKGIMQTSSSHRKCESYAELSLQGLSDDSDQDVF